MESRLVVDIPIEKITVSLFQARKTFADDELNELATSIQVHGVLQPVIVRATQDGYQLIAGERRVRACKLIHVQNIAAVVLDIDGIDVPEVSLIENLQRSDLNCLEEADAFQVLEKQFGLSNDEIAGRIGKSRSYVANMLRMLRLPIEIKDALRADAISMGHGRALLGIKGEDDQLKLLAEIIKKNLSVRQTEKRVKCYQEGEGKVPSQAEQAPQRTEKMSIDKRIFYNTLKKTLKEIQDAGGKTEMYERETESYFEIVVRVKK